MLIDLTIITKFATGYKILTTILGTIALLTGAIWLLVLLVNLIVEGLRLLQTSWLEANVLVANMPALHFLLLLALFCCIVGVGVKLVTMTVKYLRWGVHYVRY